MEEQSTDECLHTALGQKINTGNDYRDHLVSKYTGLIKEHLSSEQIKHCTLSGWTACTREVGFRNYVKLVVTDDLQIGLYRAGSHEVIDGTQCPTHHPHINVVLQKIQARLKDLSKEQEALPIKYVSLKVNPLTLETLLTFVSPEKISSNLLRDFVFYLNVEECHIVSAFLNVNPTPGNEVFGPENIWIFGKESLKVTINDHHVLYGPTSFMQSNLYVAELLYQRIDSFVGIGRDDLVAWDWYCGTGVMSLHLAKAGYKVTAVEENPGATKFLEASVKREGVDKAITIHTERLEDYLDHFDPSQSMPDFIIVNPSRRGLAQRVSEFLGQILTLNPFCTLIYVSCDLTTFSRDLDRITSEHVFLKQLEAFDMFPHTDHLEWLGIFQAKQYKDLDSVQGRT